MTKKVTQNVTNSNSEDLTEQWKKGKLDRNKIYYYETPFNTVDTASGYWLCNHLDTEKDKVEILNEVPSYEELQNQAFILKSRESEIVKKETQRIKLMTKLNDVNNENHALRIKNNRLKELLKEVLRHELSLKEVTELTRKISEVLGE